MENNEGPTPQEVLEQEHPAVQKAEKVVAQHYSDLLPGEERMGVYAAWMDALTSAARAREEVTGVKLSKWGEFRMGLHSRWRAITAGTKELFWGATTWALNPVRWVFGALYSGVVPYLEKTPLVGQAVRVVTRPIEALGNAMIVNYRHNEMQHAYAYKTAQEMKYASIRVGRAGKESAGIAIKKGAESVGKVAITLAETYTGAVKKSAELGGRVVDRIADAILGKEPVPQQPPQPKAPMPGMP